MTKTVLLAGVLGGLLGGAGALAVVKFLPASAESQKAEQALQPFTAPAEGRAVAEAFLGKLKAMKYNDFLDDVKSGMNFLNDGEFAAFKKAFLESRTLCHNVYGNLTGEYELLREYAPRPELVRLVYLEKFERGAVSWAFILYRSSVGWRLNDVRFNINLSYAFPGDA